MHNIVLLSARRFICPADKTCAKGRLPGAPGIQALWVAGKDVAGLQAVKVALDLLASDRPRQRAITSSRVLSVTPPTVAHTPRGVLAGTSAWGLAGAPGTSSTTTHRPGGMRSSEKVPRILPELPAHALDSSTTPWRRSSGPAPLLPSPEPSMAQAAADAAANRRVTTATLSSKGAAVDMVA